MGLSRKKPNLTEFLFIHLPLLQLFIQMSNSINIFIYKDLIMSKPKSYKCPLYVCDCVPNHIKIIYLFDWLAVNLWQPEPSWKQMNGISSNWQSHQRYVDVPAGATNKCITTGLFMIIYIISFNANHGAVYKHISLCIRNILQIFSREFFLSITTFAFFSIVYSCLAPSFDWFNWI